LVIVTTTGDGPAADAPHSATITVKARSSRFGDVPDMTPEELRQRGDAADAMFRGMVAGLRQRIAAWRGVGSQHANAKLAFGTAAYLSIMSAPLTSVQWLVRAEDARLDAAAVNDPQVKRMLLVMAAGYERLAAHAVCLEQSGLPHEGARADFQLRGVRGTPRSW
jgi:hypothetical protein